MSYSLWTREGYLEDANDLYAALKMSRRICMAQKVCVEVRDERGISLGVACPPTANGADMMNRARKRNQEILAAPKLKRSSGCDIHDWIDSERHPDRLYRCRMCDVIGQRAMTIVQAITCDQCHRGATVGQRGQNGNVAWFCEVHRS